VIKEAGVDSMAHTQLHDGEIHYTDAQLIGHRLHMTRIIAEFSRQNLGEKIGVSAAVVDAWEKGKVKLSEKNAKRACTIFSNAGVRCSDEWLMTGNGAVPRITSSVERFMNSGYSAAGCSSLPNVNNIGTIVYDTYVNPIDYKLKIKHLPEDIRNELSFFINFHSSAIFHLVEKEFLDGRYNPGDCVAGIEESLALLNGKTIIAVLDNGTTMLCKLCCHSNANCQVLVDDYPGENNCNLHEVRIARAAKIIWHRIRE
jgi:DNA-binding XRE family transcriptional regulator